ncbi:MAG: YicC/YloC family endoribonuclease [Acutalibacteraceae bacterium]|nr:YicC family protein [Clostridiales bacterium]MEE0156299.1 YicC/YloC family endoribonuclease [Acutalibacteraceae bacterium]
MVKSMTGYGRCEETVGGRRITVELKSVNHKYFEFSPRVTRGYGFLEDKLKSYVQSRVARGKIDLFLSIETLEDADVVVSVNHSLAAGYIAALREITERYKLPDTVTVNSLSRYSDIFSVHKAPEDEEAIWAAVQPVAEKAVDAFIAMRETEGSRLYEDVMARAAVILELVGKIEARSPETVKAYRERLEMKLREVLSDTAIDEQRILTEAAIFADKVAVAEETVRLRSHFEQLKSLLGAEEPSGRKMDFLVQEMNRETNTIGSKASDSQIAYMVVDIKAEIEKIREQIQNIE